jgi:hypothetical protein
MSEWRDAQAAEELHDSFLLVCERAANHLFDVRGTDPRGIGCLRSKRAKLLRSGPAAQSATLANATVYLLDELVVEHYVHTHGHA